MKRFILLFLLSFMTREAICEESRDGNLPDVHVRQGVISAGDAPALPGEPIRSSVHLTLPAGGSMDIPSDVLNSLDADARSRLLESHLEKPSSASTLLLRKEILIPAIVFATGPIMVWIFAYFAFRSRKETHNTIRLAIQSGQTLPEGVMNALEHRRMPSAQGDLRKAVLLGCLGVGGALILFVANQDDPSISLLGLVPCILGLGYLFLWRQASRQTRRFDHERV
jgi:hypothetical protein